MHLTREYRFSKVYQHKYAKTSNKKPKFCKKHKDYFEKINLNDYLNGKEDF